MSMPDLLAPPEEQAKIMSDALNRIKAHAFYMKKSLESERVLEAIRHAVEMASELRIGSLTPKNYYELYMLAFDNLRYVASMLSDAHRSKRANLAELYELVQYSPNIVPRLYLMITVGAAYMPMGETPIKIILRDLIDMTRGVQHPVRGLFLRHYLSSMTKDFLPDGDTLERSDLATTLPITPPNVSVPYNSIPTNGQLPSSPQVAVLPVNTDLGSDDGESHDRVSSAESAEADSTAAQRSPSISSASSPTDGNVTAPSTSNPASPKVLSATSPGPTTAFHGTADDSITFVMQNFVEMNKLWVRLQHQGSTKERERREAERKELRILVGTNIVRLSQLQTVDLNMYKTQILPPILDQIINCRDVIAQEYLMEVIIQVFPDSFHLRTLEPVLAVTAQLQPQVNIKQVIVALIDRLRTYAATHQEKIPIAEGDEKEENNDMAVPSSNTSVIENEEREGIPENLQLFDVFWAQITQVITARPDLGLADISSLLLSLIQLSVACYPDQISYVDQILRFARDQSNKYLGTPDLTNATTVYNFQALLLAPLQSPDGNQTGVGGVPARPIMWLLQLPNDAQAFRELLALQPYSTRHAVALYLTNHLVRQRSLISTESHLLALLECIQVLVKDQKDAPLWKNTGMFVDREALGTLRTGAGGTVGEADKRREQLDELGLEQSLIAKFVSLIGNSDTAVHAQLLIVARKSLAEGGGFRIKHTFPALLTQAVRLVDRVIVKHRDTDNDTSIDKNNTSESNHSARDQELMQLFKCMHQLIMNIQHKSDDVVLAKHLFLVSARSADVAGLEEIAYEFFVSALTVYEECINDSRVQFASLTAIIDTLLECRVFAVDNYDTLSTKCTLHASRLLKRPDQCRAVIQCSHLFWSQTEKCREGKRVLECLQKALKFADACLDSVMNVELLIETLARYFFYYEKGCPTITVKSINSLLELIATNLANLHESGPDASDLMVNGTSSNGGAVNDSNIILGRGFSTSYLVAFEVGGGGDAPQAANSLAAVTAHFKRTITMIQGRLINPPKSLGEQQGPFYNDIVVPRSTF